jgi:hypothetical protein
VARWQRVQIDSLLFDWELREEFNNVQQARIFVTAQVCQGFFPLLVWMKGKWMLESNTTICMELPTCCFSPINSMKNEKPLVLESNTPPLICYESYLYQQWGFLDYSQLLKIKLNGSLPINDTTQAHGIHECHHIVDWCITDKRSWSSWPLVLWVPFTL